MTLAVVVATEATPSSGDAGQAPAPTAELPLGETTPLERLLDQLAEQNVRETHVITRPELAPVLRKDGYEVIESEDQADDLREIARLAQRAKQQLIIAHGDVVTHGEVLTRALSAPGGATAVIAAGRRRTEDPTRPVLRVTKGRVTSAGSRYHQVTDPNAVFRGVLVVSAGQTRTLARVADELADLLPLPDTDPVRYRRREPKEIVDDSTGDEEVDAAGEEEPQTLLGGTAPSGADTPALLLTGLVRSGVWVGTRGVRVLKCERVLDAGQAELMRDELDQVDEDRQRLIAAVKNNDGFFTTYAVSTYSRYIARWSARRGLTPNMVTSISMGIAVLAAVWFAAGNRLGMVLGGGLLYFAFVFDCVDGQLARYTRKFSTLGAWLDATFDRAKEYVVYAGLAAGSTAAASGAVHGGDVWALAVAAMTLQTCRHMVDFSFGAAKRRKPPEHIPLVALTDPDDSVLDPPQKGRAAKKKKGLGAIALWLSARSEKISALRWAKKIIVLPIGERFALISITAMLFNAKVTFIALLAWGGFAMLYSVAGRFLRSLHEPRITR